MTPLEERICTAINAKAHEIPPGVLPPLRLPVRRRLPVPRWLPGRRGLTLMAPIAAAAAVTAAIAAVFAASGAIPRPALPQPGAVIAPSTPPRYYVALTFTGNGQCCQQPGEFSTPWTHAVVRATATGRAVATVWPQRPYQTFTGVSASYDDRTFVLAAQRLSRLPQFKTPPTKLFMLRLGSGGHALRLTPLPIRPLAATVYDLALSPNGAFLAVTAGQAEPSVSVFNLATGAERTWSPPGIGTSMAVGATQGSLSWTADSRTLALIYWGRPNGGGVRLLNVSARGSNLLANSRLAVGQPPNAAGLAYWIQARVTPDGHTIIAIRDRIHHAFSQQLVAFSAQTGKVLSVLSDIRFEYGNDEHVGWASPSGKLLIVTDVKRGHQKPSASVYDANAGLLTDGHYTPLPWSPDTFTAAW